MAIYWTCISGNRHERFQDAQSVRMQVFVEEQGIDPSLELDSIDEYARHYIAYLDQKQSGLLPPFDVHFVPPSSVDASWDPIATMRIFSKPSSKAISGQDPIEAVKSQMGKGQILKIGRLAVRPSHRKLGIGSVLLRAAEADIAEQSQSTAVKFFLHSQFDKRHFYEKNGYQVVPDPTTGAVVPFMEDGIMHIAMIK
jgi:predicted GNAT family N-acyltransferase